MTKRTTRTEVLAAFHALDRAVCKLRLIDIEHGAMLMLDEGSPSMGNSWRVYIRQPEGDDTYTVSFLRTSHVGMTKREAADTMWAAAYALRAVIDDIDPYRERAWKRGR